MSITDELREYIDRHEAPCLGMAKAAYLRAIADRIDAEYEKTMSRAGQLLADAEKDRDYNYANWQDCKQKVLQGNITFDELNARIEGLEDELSHCIELPKDADDEYIYMDDHMSRDSRNGFANKQVTDISYHADGHVTIRVDESLLRWHDADKLHHHHPDTWERIIEDALDGYHDTDFDALVARCRALASEPTP